MKKWNRVISLLLCAVMLTGLLPNVVWAVENADGTVTLPAVETTATYYVLTDTLTSGHSYLIVNSNTAGDAVALANGGNGNAAATPVNIQTGDYIGTYIQLADSADEEWIVTSYYYGYQFTNNQRYLDYGESNQNGYYLEVNRTCRWTYSDDRLYVSIGGNNSRYYVGYSNNSWNISQQQSNVYFYERTTVPIDSKPERHYALEADNVFIYRDVQSGQVESRQVVPKIILNGAELTSAEVASLGGTYHYQVISGGDVVSVSDTGVVTASGNGDGAATIRVSYTWNEDGSSHTLWKNISVTYSHSGPVYSLDLCEPVTVDGKTTYEPITKPIVKKNIKAGDTDSVWAVVRENGKDLGDLNDDALTWISSDTTIATVDTHTGEITFTGVEGTVSITAVYGYEGGSVTDMVIFSVSKGNYIVPSDGTDDFPDYPNEGAVRFDKHATAVGNFNETGVVQIELSMTGVPYSTGSEIDVVIMLDMSTSMNQNGVDRVPAAQNATKAALEALVMNEDGTFNGNRVAVYGFNGWDDKGSQAYSDQIENIIGSTPNYNITELASMGNYDAESYAELLLKIDNYDAYLDSGTNYAAALKQCYTTLKAARASEIGKDRKQFVIFMTDGAASTGFAYQSGDSYELYDYNDLGSNGFSIIGEVAGKTEWYSTQMKNDGVEVYTVGVQIQGSNDTQTGQAKTVLKKIAGTKAGDGTTNEFSNYAQFVEAGGNLTELTTIFQSIASEIRQAATNVVVEDKISGEFSLILELPDAIDPAEAENAGLTDQEFYIELVEYVLDANKNRTEPPYTLSRIYLGKKNTDGSYYAASDSNGTKYETPSFKKKTEDHNGYWTENSTKSTNGVSVLVDDKTYYFTSKGDGECNMTSGAALSGTSSDNMVIVTPYFVYNASTQMLVWTAESVHANELALRYFLYLDSSIGYPTEEQIEAGTYKTNDYATFTYENFQGTEVQQTFPVPQITWNGAQVSYVFYLVNEDGQPVNRAGRVVPFSEAVYVTDVFTMSVTWNDLEQTESLDAPVIAEDLLPDIYALYDPAARYTIHVFEKETGEDLNNHFKIEGAGAVNTTYVFNSKSDAAKYSAPDIYAAQTDIHCKDYDVTVGENGEYEYNGSGVQYEKNGQPIYDVDDIGVYTIVNTTVEADNVVKSGFDFANTTVAFAVLWQPELRTDTVVIDYGLDVVIDVTTNDQVNGTLAGLTFTQPVDNDGEPVAINSGVVSNPNGSTSIELTNSAGTVVGDASIINSNVIVNLFRTDSTGMQLTEPIVFYYLFELSYYQNSNTTALVHAYMYSSVTIIPASTVYYEEEFVTYNPGGTEHTDTDGKVYTSVEWVADGNFLDAVQDTDRPGFGNVTTGYDADNVYGYDSHYLTSGTYSLGRAMKVTVNADTFATATFTFYGTGFDLISLTSNLTGTVIAEIKNMSTNDVEQIIFVDTYYGSKYQEVQVAQRDENGNIVKDKNGNIVYVVKTDERGDTITDAEGNPVYVTEKQWGADSEANDTLYQVPVITARDLEGGYNKYQVNLTVSYNEEHDYNEDGENDFYLDAVRIYDPTGTVANKATDTATAKAYIADGEWSPSYEEIRNELLNSYGKDNIFNNAVITTPSDTTDTSEESENSTATTDAVMPPNFIDGNAANQSVVDYMNYGPNNELYLAAGQSLSMWVDGTFLRNISNLSSIMGVADIQLGLKSADGDPISIEISNYVYDAGQDTYVLDKATTLNLTTATDMFYSIADYFEGVVVIENLSGGVLSITDIKVTLQPEYKATDVPNVDAGSANTLLDDGNTEKTVNQMFEVLETFYIGIVIAVADVFSDIDTLLNAIYQLVTAVI